MKVPWLFSWALAMQAASLAPLTLTVPAAFEENRGQSPEAFRYLVSHINMGFACDAIYGRSQPLPSPTPMRIEFLGANSGCSSQVLDADGTYSHYYRGVAKSGSVERVLRYRRLRFTDLWPGITLEYRASADRITATFQLRAASDLRSVRLSAPNLSPMSGGIGSPLGIWKISARQAGNTPVTAAVDGMGLSFVAPEADSGAAMTLSIEIPVAVDVVAPRWVSSASTAVGPEGGWYVAAATTAFSELDTTSATCIEFSLTNRCPDVFVGAFDRSGALRYLVYLLGARHEQVSAVALDPGGNVYVAGATYSSDFVTTQGVLQPQYRGPEVMRTVLRVYQGGDGFLAKLHGPSGSLIWSTLVGTEEEDSIRNVAADGNGRTYLTISSASENLPSLGAPVSVEAACCQRVMSLSEDGSQIRYAVAVSYQEIRNSPTGAAFLLRMEANTQQILALNDDGSVRYRRSIQLPAIQSPASIALGANDSLWLSAVVREPLLQRPLGWVLHRLTANGELSAASPEIFPQGIGMRGDENGGLWLSLFSLDAVGTTPDAVLRYRCEACGALVRVDSSGAVRYSTYIPYTAFWMEAAAGRVYVRSVASTPGQPDIYVLDEAAPAVPVLASVTDTSSPYATLNPGNVITLAGAAIGPGSIVEWPRDADGLAATTVEGVQVMIDDAPGRILGASSDRITVMVPLGRTSFENGTLRVLHEGVTVASAVLPSSSPGYAVLAGTNAPLGFTIRNDDGSANTVENPARPGSVIQFFVVSVGPVDPSLVDGEYIHTALAAPRRKLDVHFGIGSPRAEVLSFAQSPAHVAGIFEVRVRLPETVPAGISKLPIVFAESGRVIFQWQVPQVNVR